MNTILTSVSTTTLLCLVSLGFAINVNVQTQQQASTPSIGQSNAPFASNLQYLYAVLEQARASYQSYNIDQPLYQQILRELEALFQNYGRQVDLLDFAVQVYSDFNWHIRVWEYGQQYVGIVGIEQGNADTLELIARAGSELGFTAYQLGDTASALSYYEQSHALSPSTPSALLWLARLYFETEQPAKALPLWQQASDERLAESASYYLERTQQQLVVGVAASNAFYEGIQHYEAEELETAREAFQRATDANDSFVDAWVWLARSNLESDRTSEAARAWQQVVTLNPEDQRALYFLNVANQQLRWGGEAASAFEAGIGLYEVGNLQAANLKFVEASEKNRLYVDAFRWAARSYQELGNLDEAQYYWQVAKTLAPYDDSIEYFLHQVNAQIGSAGVNIGQQRNSSTSAEQAYELGLEAYNIADYQNALLYFEQAVLANPSWASARAWLARIYFEQADYARASQHYDLALELEPDNNDYKFFSEEAKFLANP